MRNEGWWWKKGEREMIWQWISRNQPHALLMSTKQFGLASGLVNLRKWPTINFSRTLWQYISQVIRPNMCNILRALYYLQAMSKRWKRQKPNRAGQSRHLHLSKESSFIMCFTTMLRTVQKAPGCVTKCIGPEFNAFLRLVLKEL